MTQKPEDYQILIVRAWKRRPTQSDPETWRFTLTVSATEARHGFSSPEALCNAIYKILTDVTDSKDP